MASSLYLTGEEVLGDISLLKEALGITQHHDAVSGTEKQHVADDYARILSEGLAECHKTAASYYRWIKTILTILHLLVSYRHFLPII